MQTISPPQQSLSSQHGQEWCLQTNHQRKGTWETETAADRSCWPNSLFRSIPQSVDLHPLAISSLINRLFAVWSKMMVLFVLCVVGHTRGLWSWLWHFGSMEAAVTVIDNISSLITNVCRAPGNNRTHTGIQALMFREEIQQSHRYRGYSFIAGQNPEKVSLGELIAGVGFFPICLREISDAAVRTRRGQDAEPHGRRYWSRLSALTRSISPQIAVSNNDQISCLSQEKSHNRPSSSINNLSHYLSLCLPVQ